MKVKYYKKVKKFKLIRIDTNTSEKALTILKETAIKDTKYASYIEEFIETLKSEGSSYDFTLLANNLRNLKIAIVPQLDGCNMAKYDVLHNVLHISKQYIDRMDEIIYHEIFHISSSYKENDEVYIGFQRNYLFKCFNEGYTEVLTKRYFGDKSTATPYLFEMMIAEILESIIGRAKMENLYSKADSLGMLVEFSKYTDKEETTYITLGNVDRMSEHYENQEYKESMEWFRNILLILINAFIKKCQNGISKEKVTKFFRLFPLFYTYEGKDYDIFTQEEINKYKKICYTIANNTKKLKKKLAD